MDRRFASRGVSVIGVHTPEFDRERDPAAVRKEVRRLGVGYPVVLDNESRMWDALDNRYWPSLYLIDRQGRIRGRHQGEIHSGTDEARTLEDFIETLLREPATESGEEPPAR